MAQGWRKEPESMGKRVKRVEGKAEKKRAEKGDAQRERQRKRKKEKVRNGGGEEEGHADRHGLGYSTD